MQSSPTPLICEFGDFELDSLKRVVVSRTTGQPLDITGRVAEALVYLVERPGQLVEKKTLMDALWPHVVVEEGNLTQTIHSLRRALGERAGEDRYIATVPGRGYRFVAEVKVRGPQAAAVAAPPRRPKRLVAWSAAAAVLVAAIGFVAWRAMAPAGKPAVPAQRSIAVLAFEDMSPEQDQAYFAEGLSEEILNLLTRAESLRVIARTSSFAFKDENADIRTIAQRLMVSHVLEGSVRKAGERVRITAQLIDGSTGAHVWSDTYDRDLDDIFGVQREIASAVADELHVTLRRAAPRRAETTSAQAYEAYLQGRHLFHRRAGNDLAQAKLHFERAVAIDPEYGRAWAGLAGVYSIAEFEAPEFAADTDRWREATERAIQFAPELAEGHIRAAKYQWRAGNERAAHAHFDRAQALDPEDPLVLSVMASMAAQEGRHEDAVAFQKRVVAADPISAINRGNLGSMLMMVDRYAEAQAEFEVALELSPATEGLVASVADAHILQGNVDEAMAAIARLPEGIERDQRYAMAYYLRGDVTNGDAMLARLLAQAETPQASPMLEVAIAEVYAFRHDKDHAFTWLNKAWVLARNQPGASRQWSVIEALHLGTFLRPLHADPRWPELVAAVDY